MQDKQADLAGPGIGDYNELEKILPQDYSSLLSRKKHKMPSMPLKTTSKAICAKN
jgi:aspartate--ammonia ligase